MGRPVSESPGRETGFAAVRAGEKRFSRRMPGQVAAASCYLSQSELAAPARLRALGAALDEIAGTAALAERIVAAADTAFRSQRRWMRHLPMSELSGSYRHV